MKNAVLEIKGKQYLVFEDTTILTDKLSGELDYKVLLVTDDKTKIGKPELDKKLVELKVVDEEIKDQKLRVFKYKAKSRYRKTRGFRARKSKLQVVKINI